MTHITRKKRNPVDRVILRIARRFGDKAIEVERFLKFVTIGALGAVVDLVTLTILQATVLPPLDSLYVIIATTIAFLTAVTHNFILNRFWTYPDSRSRSARRQMAQFTVISFIGWAIRTVWISLAYVPLGVALMPSLLPVIQIFDPLYSPATEAVHKLGTLVATLIGIAVIMNWNFLANRLWTYNDVGKAKVKDAAEVALS